MAVYRVRESKQDDAGAEVTLYQDKNDSSWAVGRRPDAIFDPIPLASFVTADAARKWADAQFRGGTWKALPAQDLYHV
jgi:hypothetical protein